MDGGSQGPVESLLPVAGIASGQQDEGGSGAKGAEERPPAGSEAAEQLEPSSAASAASQPPAAPKDPPSGEEAHPLGIFGKFLTIWVALAMVVGVVIGTFAPSVAEALNEATVAEISIPVAILLWVMIYPMLLQIDFAALTLVWRHPRAIVLATCINYLVQPFTMYGFAVLFFRVAFRSTIDDEDLEKQYLAGSVVLGGAPCTAMVFVWSYLVTGDAAYTLMQVAVNDLIMLVAYVPTVGLLLDASDIEMPWDTLVLAVVIFIVVPLVAALVTRFELVHRQKRPDRIVAIDQALKPFTVVALLLTLVLVFIFQGKVIVENLLHILLIAVPLTLQTYVIFAISYAAAYAFGIRHRYAAPAAMIATSNFFELAVAVAISLYGLDSGATLATVVGVLEEVPVMLTLVWFCNRTRHWFDAFEPDAAHAAAATAGKTAGEVQEPAASSPSGVAKDPATVEDRDANADASHATLMSTAHAAAVATAAVALEHVAVSHADDHTDATTIATEPTSATADAPAASAAAAPSSSPPSPSSPSSSSPLDVRAVEVPYDPARYAEGAFDASEHGAEQVSNEVMRMLHEGGAGAEPAADGDGRASVHVIEL